MAVGAGDATAADEARRVLDVLGEARTRTCQLPRGPAPAIGGLMPV
jgi:hypothetical protein